MTGSATSDDGDLPRVVCLMTSSLDGRLHPGRWTASPDGDVAAWSADYEGVHDAIGADAWLVGRVTMAEMAKRTSSQAMARGRPPRPLHLVRRDGPFAVALDPSGRLRFGDSSVGGDHVVVLLGGEVDDDHLAGLVADGVSYVVASERPPALAPLLATLRRELGVGTLVVEGGGRTVGSFLAAGLVDEFHVVLAPTVDGSASPSIVDFGEGGLKGLVELSLGECAVLDSGALHLRYSARRG